MVDTNSDDPLEKLRKLSGQERKVLTLRCKGLDYKTIGTLLHISEDTVKGYMQRIYVKLGIDIIPPAERMKTIYQVYCPLIESPQLPPARPEDEVVEGTFEPLPREVEKMVDEDEYPIVHVAPTVLQAPATPAGRDKKRPRVLTWLILGVVLGICLGVVAVFQFNKIFSGDSQIAGAVTPATQVPVVVEVTRLVTLTPMSELSTQTPVIVQQVVVVTATPVPPTPLPTSTDAPSVTLPFEDTFELRARPEWEISTGTWRVVDGYFTAETNGWQIAFVGDPNWHNHRIEVTTFSKDFVYPIRIIARASKDGYIAFEFYSSGARWLLVKSGTEVQIADMGENFKYDTTHKIIVEVIDDIYTAYVNGIQYSQIQDTTYSNGRVGIGFDSPYLTWFDNFQVQEITQ